MTFIHNVTPGDPWYPKASNLNSLARSANFAGRSGAGQMPRAFGSNTTIQIYNATNTAFVKGQAVSFTNAKPVVENYIMPAVALVSPDGAYGVCDEDILPNGIGNCVVSGTVLVNCQGSGDHAKPAASGLYFVLGTEGQPVLQTASGVALLCVGGGSSGGGGDVYDFDKDAANVMYLDGDKYIVTEGNLQVGNITTHFDRQEILVSSMPQYWNYGFAIGYDKNTDTWEYLRGFSTTTTKPKNVFVNIAYWTRASRQFVRAWRGGDYILQGYWV